MRKGVDLNARPWYNLAYTQAKNKKRRPTKQSMCIEQKRKEKLFLLLPLPPALCQNFTAQKTIPHVTEAQFVEKPIANPNNATLRCHEMVRLQIVYFGRTSRTWMLNC